MRNYQPVMSFGENVAVIYDEISIRGDEASTVAFLKGLAKNGLALELAIGTGRIALPLAAEGVRVDGIVTRFAWPSELDLMARIAGLRLRERWGGWKRQPFTAESKNCISVYQRAA